MKNIRSYIIISVLFLVCFTNSEILADDFIGFKTTQTMTIDGVGDEAIWDSAAWYPMKYVWLPYNDIVDSLDFSGRFKIVWDSARLYVLVEVVDDSLYDGHPNPLDNYWNDDCVEVFLDEDHSGGPHNDVSNQFNAFAMHVSTLFDVVDNGLSGTALFNNLISANLTKNDSLYVWELAIKVYPATYNQSSPGDPLKLTPNKEMGFSLAYCDDDGSNVRENFIASTNVTEANQNNSWLNASIFGKLTLYDPDYVPPTPSSVNSNLAVPLKLYPNPASDILYYSINDNAGMLQKIKLINLAGQVVLENSINNSIPSGSISVNNIERGTYMVEIITDKFQYTRQIVLF